MFISYPSQPFRILLCPITEDGVAFVTFSLLCGYVRSIGCTVQWCATQSSVMSSHLAIFCVHLVFMADLDKLKMMALDSP
jgi:hypothetical protein